MDNFVTWKAISNWRGQSHDINALEFIENRNTLISAGLTTDLTLYAIDEQTGTLDSKKYLINDTSVKNMVEEEGE